MRILAITQKNSGVGYHRIMLPLVNMKKDYCFITDTIDEETLEKGFDIVVFNRLITNVTLDKIVEWKNKYNFKLVVDNDDHWRLDPNHILYERYLLNDITQRIIDYIQIADVCTVTHERLADEVYKINKNVYILPNAIPYGEEQYIDKKIDSDKVRLFWSGSNTHEHDIKILKNPLKRVHDLPIKMVMSGYVEDECWNRMVYYFSNGRKLDTQLYRYNEVIRYMEAYGDSDISLIPLQDSFFNSMKSNLKVLETAAKKNPAIVSNVHPYKGMPVHYVNSQKDWYKHIKDLTYDKQARKESGLKLFEYCDTNYNLHLINEKRHNIYRQICP